MGVLQQIRLLLNKNILFRKRHPGLLLLEVVWPILIVAIVALVRVAVPPKEHSVCHYQDRAMPSAGVVPFMQTFICNLDNKCHSEDSRTSAQQNAASVSKLLQQISPYLSDDGTLDMLDNVENGVILINRLSDMAQNNTLMDELNNVTSLSRYFKDPDIIKGTLVNDYGFSQQAVDALMDSQANLTGILHLSGYPDLKGVACDPQRLSDFLVFPNGTDTAEISKTLCSINSSKIPEITDFLQRHLDIAEVIRLLALFENLKERLSIPYTLGQGLNDVADMMDLLLSVRSLTDAVTELMEIKNLPDLIRNIPQWINDLRASDSVIEPMQAMMKAVDPIVEVYFPNDTAWHTLQEGILFAGHFADLFLSNTNMTNDEFIKESAGFMQDMEDLFNGMAPDMKEALNAMSSVRWSDVIDAISSGADNSTQMMEAVQYLTNVMEQIPEWENMTGIVSVVTDMMHTVNILLDELNEGRQNLEDLWSGRGELKQTLDRLLREGPDVTLAMLKAFTHSDTFAALLVEKPDFSRVCSDIVAAMRDDVGQTIATELNGTLCFGDVSVAINTMLQEFDVKGISIAVNRTITKLADLTMGRAMKVSVNFGDIYRQFMALTQKVEITINSTFKSWAELMSVQDVVTKLAQDHTRDWEPVLDMLNANYFGSSVLSLLGAAGDLMNDSSSAEMIDKTVGPYLHMANVMVKNIFNQMEIMMDTYSIESPLGQLIYYGTNYAPEIMSALIGMTSDAQVDMIYKVTSSKDPLSTFCNENMMQQMSLPSVVVVNLEQVVCTSNWTQVTDQLMSVQNTYNVISQEMAETMAEMNSVGGIQFSLQDDWRELSYYVSRLMDMMTPSPQPTGNDDVAVTTQLMNMMSMGPWNLANYANYSQIMVAMEMMIERMDSMTDDDWNVLMNVFTLAMENIDDSMKNSVNGTSPPEWRRLKHYAKMMEDVNIVIMDSTSRNSQSLSEYLEIAPKEVKDIVYLAADAYPELIDALANIMFKNPYQLLEKLTAEGLQPPNCGNVTVTGLLLLTADSSFGRLEKEVCTANWTSIGEKLASQSESQAATEAMTDLVTLYYDLEKLALDPEVNWTQVVHSVQQVADVMEAQLQGSEMSELDLLLPFNITAINAKWSQFYKDIEQTQNLDYARLSVAISELTNMMQTDLAKMMPNNTELIMLLNGNMYLTYHVMEFANIQMEYFTTHQNVDILDMLGSDELRRAAEVLRYSPEINEIGVNTIMRILKGYPTQYLNPIILCDNLTLFSSVFAVDDSIMNTALLQQTVCSLNLNITLLQEQLEQNWNGFAELMQAFDTFAQSDTLLDVDSKFLDRVQTDYMNLLEQLMTTEVSMTIFGGNDRWTNMTLYAKPWEKLGEQLMSMYSSMEESSMMSSVTQMLNGLAADPQMQSALVLMDYVLDMVQRGFGDTKPIPETLVGYPNMQKAYSLLEQLPELLEMVTYTSMFSPEKITRWGDAMMSWEAFCSTDPSTLMSPSPASHLDLNDVFSRLCSINDTQLMAEFNAYQAVGRLDFLFENAQAPQVNVTALSEKLSTLMEELSNANLSISAMNYDLRIFNSSVWEGVFERMGIQFNQSLERAMSPEYFLQMVNLTASLSPEFGGWEGTIKQGMALLDVMLDQVLLSLKGGSLQDMFRLYPTLSSVVTLMDRLPRIYETLAYTGIFTPEKLSASPEAFMSLEGFCGMDINKMLSAPPGSNYDLPEWQQMICSINITDMLEELAAFQGMDRLTNILMPNSTFSVNVTAVSEKLAKVNSEFGKMLTGNMTSLDINTYFNLTAWGAVMSRVEIWMQNSSQLYRLTDAVMMLYKDLSPNLPSEMKIFEPVYAFVNLFATKLLDYENMTSLSLEKLFIGEPEMQKLVRLLEEPGVIEVLFESANSKKFEPLLSNDSFPVVAAMLCNPFVPLDTYLTVPADVTIDLASIKTQFCSLDIEALQLEAMNFLDIEGLITALNDSSAVNYTEVSQQIGRMSAMITRWSESPPDFALPTAWQNESYWINLLTRYSTSREDPNTIAEEIYNSLEKMGPLLLEDPMRQIGLVVQTMMRIINENLMALQGQSLTLENMFERIPVVQEVFSALGVEGDVLDAMLEAPIQSNQMLLEALLTNGTQAQASVCNITRLNELLKLPLNFDSTALYKTVCLGDSTEAVNNLIQNLDLQSLITSLETPGVGADLKLISQQAMDLQKNLEDLMRYPPSFNATSFLASLESTFNTSDMWQVSSAFNFDGLQQLVSMFPELQYYTGVLKSAEVLGEFLNDMSNRLMFDGVTLDLASLFSSSPSFVRMIDAALQSQPDVITALSSIQLRPSKINEYTALVTQAPEQLATMICSPTEILEYFYLPEGVNITKIQQVLCSLNYTQFVEELNENFMVAALTKKLEVAMNSSEPPNLEKYIATYQSLVERIITLAGAKNVTFDGFELDKALNVNMTRLLETLESVSNAFMEEYASVGTSSLNSAMGMLNSTEGETIVFALKVMEVYLKSFNKALGDISSRPITLASIMNNTEVGKIVMPFLNSPYKLDDLLNLEVLPSKLSALFMAENATAALCGSELFSAFAAPGNESAVLKQLQSSMCKANTTVMMWQAIFGQAQGFQLYQQMELLYREVQAGKVNINITSISDSMEHLIAMMTQIIGDYQNGTRSAEDLLDWQSFEMIFNRFSQSLGSRLLNMTQTWSTDLSMAVLMSMPDDGSGSMARMINSINIFMEVINDRLEDMLKSGVSLSSLLNHSEDLVDLMEAYLTLARLTPQAWLDGDFSMNKLVEVSANETLRMELCTSKTMSSYLADTEPVTSITSVMQTVICSITTELPETFRQFIDYEAINKKLEDLYNMSIPVQPEYQQYMDNTAKLNALITQLATTTLTVDPKLPSQFNFTSAWDAMQNILTDPKMLFRPLKALGFLTDGPLRTNDLDNALFGINAYIARPLMYLVQRMDAANVSVATIMSDPGKLLDALPVLASFDVQFDVLNSAYVEITLNELWNNVDFRTNYLCNGNLPEDVFTSVGLKPSVVSELCAAKLSDWIGVLMSHNITQTQVVAWVMKVDEVYKRTSVFYNTDMLDNQGMYWMRLMTTLESVVEGLVPDGNPATAEETSDSLDRVWTVLKDTLFDKTLESAMNYMELADSTGVKSQQWLVFKQAMKFLQTAGDLLNSGLDRMTDASGTVYLQKLFPESQKLADTLEKILGPSSASEMLVSSVNPTLFYQMTDSSQMLNIACDPMLFSTMFTFPAGTNVSAVQLDLCQTLSSRSASLQEFIDLFQAGDVLKQLDQLWMGNYSGVAEDKSLWKSMFKTVTGMVSNLERLQQAQFNASISENWLNPVLQMLNTLNQPSSSQLEDVCLNYIKMIGDTKDFQSLMYQPIVQIMDGFLRTAPMLTNLDDVVCSMATDKGLDLGAAVEVLKRDGLADVFAAFTAGMVNGTGEMQCRQLGNVSRAFSDYIEQLSQPGAGWDMERMDQCLQRVSPFFVDFMQGITQLYNVAAGLTGILTSDDISILMDNSGTFGQLMDFVSSVVGREQPILLKFTDLLNNSTSVEAYLTGVMQLAPELVDSLLESTVNLNATLFLKLSVPEIVDVLCDPAQLSSKITLPSISLINVTTISDFFCSSDVNLIASVLKDAGKSTELIRELEKWLSNGASGMIVTNMTSSLVTLITELQGVSTLLQIFDKGFDVQFLMENADTIDNILARGISMQSIVDSLSSLVGTLKYVVAPEDHNIITDIQTFIGGFIGLDLIQSRLLGAVSVADLQADVPAVQRYMVNELDFSPEAANALLSSTYSIRLFLNASDVVTEEPCEDRLPTFILMNMSRALKDEIITKFCALNMSEVTRFMEVMVPQLNIGTLVERYITYTGDEFLKTINMTQSGVQIVFKSLNDGSESLTQAAYILKNDSTLNPLLGFSPSDAKFDAMVSLQPALCGEGIGVNDQFNLNYKIGAEASTIDPEEEALMKGEFCKQLYRDVKSTNMGSVIWAYLKPILTGKILYTPDTPLAKEIISEANTVFDTLSEVQHVAKKWSEKVPSLLTLTNTAAEMTDLRDTLSNGFIQGILQSTMGVDSNTLMKGLDALQGNSVNSSDLKSLQAVAELVYNYSTCMELDRFVPVASEAELEQEAFNLFTTNSFLGGIVFLNLDDGGSRRKREAGPQKMPRHIQYKIRMDIENVPTTNRLKDRLWMPYARDNFASHLRYMRSFIQLQDMVESAIVRMHTNTSDAEYTPTGVLMQQMPFPCHKEDDFIHFLGSYLLPILMTFAWLAAIGLATYNLVYDRQNGQEEALRIQGMYSGLNFFAWLFVTVLVMAFVAAIITIIFKFGGIFTYSNGLIIFLYLLDFCFSTTLMCYFISSLFSRATLAILSVLILYFISYLPYVVLIALEVQMTAWQKTLACLSSTTAFSYGAMFITRFEEEGTGVQWESMDDKLSDSVDFAWMCYMMLIDSAIYLVLGWYIRNVKPGKFGIRQPWYFPVLPSYWCSCLPQQTRALPRPKQPANQGLHEPDPQGLDIGISVRGLRKSYKRGAEVVHGLDMDIFHDQVTSMLGHNGAAKTTTLNMMVGVLNPSGGVVLVEGKKTYGKTGLLGICPQHNTLFEYMTVYEHMEFYGGVKGHLSTLELMREIRKLLHDVDLWHVKDVPVVDLSGGMQRRLCVALAFVGGSRTIVLDEPTSGVDPHARKNIWNLILKNRPGRTILMSTHHLDEADSVSDRILVMHTGRLLSVGSPAFLKDQLGGGYKLTLNTAPMLEVKNEQDNTSTSANSYSSEMSSEHAKVMTFISSGLPSATFVESVGTDLTVSLPHYRADSSALYQFFHALDAQSEKLGVLSYGISNTTLEEVFLKLTTDADNQTSNANHDGASTISSGSDNLSSKEDTILHPSRGHPQHSVKGVSLGLQQLGALLVKRLHHYRRNWRMIISTILLPLLALVCAMAFSTIRPHVEDMRNLIMTPALYAGGPAESFAFYRDNSGISPRSEHFKDMLTATSPGIGTTCMAMADLDAGSGFRCVQPSGMSQSEKMDQVCQCNDYMYECDDTEQYEAVAQMRTKPDILLQDLLYSDIDSYLVNSYKEYIDKRFGGWSYEAPSVSGNSSTPTVKVWFNNKGYHAIPSFYNALSNNLLRSTVDPYHAEDYGITLYNHPLMLNSEQLSDGSLEAAATDVGIAMVILMALSFIPSAFMVYLVNERMSQERHMQSISGVGTILYWSASFLWDMFVYCVTLALMVAIVAAFQSEGYSARDNLGAFALLIFLYGWAVIPLMYCTLRFFKSGSAAYLTLFCCSMLLGLLTAIVHLVLILLDGEEDVREANNVMQYLFLIFPQYCLGIGLVDLASNQFQSNLLNRFGEDTYVDPYSLDMLGWKFVALSIQGLVFLLLTFLIHSRKEQAIGMTSSMQYASAKEDEDVYSEQERVHSGGDGDALLVKNISKVYRRGLKKFCAVNNLSFGVGKGECFGLLGVNGAGKTTTFNMLTGASNPSDGNAIILNKQLSSLRSHLGHTLGYCPQADALDKYLSGYETLWFHAKLQGFDSDQARQLVAAQLKRLKLEDLAHKTVGTYSGGNKRKLALAIAMLGEPPLLLLDEPTTGMDPSTRRLAWKCITIAIQKGQSVLLTSHSMDECDALCSRLAIMVNGQLKCIGSPQHLKNKFGDGYSVLLHLQGLSNNRQNIGEIFVNQFPGSIIKVNTREELNSDQHHSVVEVGIPKDAGSVADIFAAMQSIQAAHQISYYSISQTTLDNVFVNFAQEQTDDGDQDADFVSTDASSSSGSSIMKDPQLQKPTSYAYLNPEYSTGPLDSFDPEAKGKTPSTLSYENKAYSEDKIMVHL